MKNKIFHTQDLCLRTNLRCAKDSARMEINLKKYIAAIGICFMALGAACIMKKDPEEVGEELPELIIGSDNYEPYNYLDDDGKPVGIDVELAEAVCEQLGYTPVFQYIVWDKKDEYLDTGKVDCLWGSFTMNGREDEYQWAGPYLYSRQVIAVRTDSKIRNISDLAGKRVAVQATTKPEEVLLERSDPRVPEVDMVYSLSGMDEIYASLRKGYVDAITGHESALERFVGNAPDMYAILDESLYISELGVAFKNDTHQDLAKKMTQILKEMQDDGTLRDMVEKYGLDAEKALGVTNAE